MLISFTVENWKSFKEPVTLSMVAGKETQHAEHIQYVPEYKLNILPVALIYGGNASGKSNLVKALGFAKNLITSTNFDPYEKIAVDCFRLDVECLNKPSVFEFNLIIKERLFKYRFSITENAKTEQNATTIPVISQESLVSYSKGRATVLFERNYGSPFLASKKFSKDDQARLRLIAESTLDNKLVLTNSIMQKFAEFSDIFNWFRFSLVVIGPNTRASQINSEVYAAPISNIISKMDTGISRIDFEQVAISSSGFSDEELVEINSKITDENKKAYSSNHLDEFWEFESLNNELIARKMVSFHKNCKGDEVRFEIKDNSDGTRRSLHLTPAFLHLTSPGSTACYIIDEMDRSLHTHLIKQFLVSYLQTRNQDTRSQLIVTNHDVLQMDQDVLRRDEIWITERSQETAASTLIALNEFKLPNRRIRNDLLISKLYLEGQLGGVPELDTYGGLFASKE